MVSRDDIAQTFFSSVTHLTAFTFKPRPALLKRNFHSLEMDKEEAKTEFCSNW